MENSIEKKKLLENFGKIAYTLDKAYIPKLSTEYNVIDFNDNYSEIVSYPSNIRGLKVSRWVFDENEEPGECLKNVLSLFSDGDHTIGFVIRRTFNNTEMYFIIKNEGMGRNEESKNNIELMKNSLQGNFPGTRIENIEDISDLKKLFEFNNERYISVLSNVPSEKNNNYITQDIGKLLNGIVPKNETESYTILFLLESLNQDNIREILSGYEEMATSIAPYLQYQLQVGENETETIGETKSISETESIAKSIFKTHSIHSGITSSTSAGINIEGVTIGQTRGHYFGYGYSWGDSDTISEGKTTTKGTNKSISTGNSKNISYTHKSYKISNLLNKLEKTMERIQKSKSSGLWKYATYVLTEDPNTSKNIANFLRALTQGNESYIEPSVIQEWEYVESNWKTNFNEIKKYLSNFTHPIFISKDEEEKKRMLVTPALYVGTNELAHVVAFPKQSLQGLPVIQCTPFGREPHSLLKMNRTLEIGNAYHMYQEVKEKRISISKEELVKHTFITGSTGSGKSNAIYKLLDSLMEEKVKFLVIEPAKGEYKEAFRNREGVTVYGTNPKLTDNKLLKINPFKFPEDIHILEHLDRLIEIFNACWPMYAAMPAILKDALERAYKLAGWDLIKSENSYNENLYPTFLDILNQVREVLDESDYSSDNKGDYTGSLVTRIKSLTNGINGLIFSNDDISDYELFDENVIVDLSRIGSTETKALIMGLLILKLQEHRMVNNEIDKTLSHVTVLEEAHNLLKRTSTEQVGEGANLLGKAVEMLSNSIAEMRTYGEGFIIADQSPGLLDMSVIRNTNTKIILRLPVFSDRELVGKASGLNNKQIIELGRLEKGVASITQNDWLDPILCKIDKYKKEEKIINKQLYNNFKNDNINDVVLYYIMKKLNNKNFNKINIEKIIKSNLDTNIKIKLVKCIKSKGKNEIELFRELIFEFFNTEDSINKARSCNEIIQWCNIVKKSLKPSIINYNKEQVNLLLALIIYEKNIRDENYNNLFFKFQEIYNKKGGIF